MEVFLKIREKFYYKLGNGLISMLR